MYRLRVIVDEIKGFCDLPVSKGDYFEVDGGRLLVPPGKHVCIWALQAMMPFLTAKQRNIAEENDWLPTTSKIACPDPNGMVIYRIVRLGLDDVAEAIPRRILVDKEACSGCRRCELACSQRHEGSFWPERSRIVVAKDDSQGSDIPQVCRQCGTALCLQTCGAKAISRDPLTRAILIDETKCVKCGACSRACPFGAIRMANSGYPLVCDLCGGNPACVDACPTAAVNYGRAGDAERQPRFSQPGKESPGGHDAHGQRGEAR